jgi:cell wall-associated NlpC family hydrolase
VETVPETTPAQVVPVGVQASYTGGTKYVGNTVSGAELSVLGVFSDGSVYPVDGWACAQVGMALSEGSNVFVVSYGGYQTSFTVNAVVQQTAPAVDTNAELRASLVNYGMQFVGNPYVYGGTDLINGTDCSGFTMRIYEHFGISITRTSRSQAAAGREIALSDVQVGDLVFYTNIQTGQIGHVAMYIGNGKIVHAASETLGIIVSDMYYRQPCKAVTFIN